MGGGLFFHDVIFKVRLPHLPGYRRHTKEGKCGAAFSDCSWKIRHRLPAEKRAEKEKGEGTEIPVVRTAVTFHTTYFKSESRHQSIISSESRHRPKQKVLPRLRDGKRGIR